MIGLAISLDMPTVVANCRKAYLQHELQAQKEDVGRCTYSGPCAIGVSVPVDKRWFLDEQSDTGLLSLVEENHLVFSNAREAEDAAELQKAHDNWSFADGQARLDREKIFLGRLVALESKYPMAV